MLGLTRRPDSTNRLLILRKRLAGMDEMATDTKGSLWPKGGHLRGTGGAWLASLPPSLYFPFYFGGTRLGCPPWEPRPFFVYGKMECTWLFSCGQQVSMSLNTHLLHNENLCLYWIAFFFSSSGTVETFWSYEKITALSSVSAFFYYTELSLCLFTERDSPRLELKGSEP